MQRTFRRLVTGCAAALLIAAAAGGQTRQGEARRPQLNLSATPKIGFVPAKVQFAATLAGGDDDYREFYCPGIEWDWGDDTVSESSFDCEPYQAGSSRIRRRYTAQHTFNFDGLYEVKFRLKSGSRIIASVTVAVEIRPGRP
jgi:hypothetical protein